MNEHRKKSILRSITAGCIEKQETGLKHLMKLGIGVLIILIGILYFVVLNHSKDTGHKKILVGAAASLKPVMIELQAMYETDNPEIILTFTYAGSGSLEQQIRQGAPIDVYLAASQDNMEALSNEHYIFDDTKVDLLENELVLITPKDSKLDLIGFEKLPDATRIAIGDPDSVPVGKYAWEIFKYYNIQEEVEKKLTYAKDVTEVLAWVSSGNADAGIVYATDAGVSKKVEVVTAAPHESHSKVVYPAAVVKESKEKTEAYNFIQFLMSVGAKKVFEQYGFLTLGH